MYITILGRQPAIGVAELESLYAADNVRWFSDTSATIDGSDLDFERIGGSQKAGRVVIELRGDWRQASQRIVTTYTKMWGNADHKITLGISAYGFATSAREVQKTGLILKKKLRESGVSLRLVPNQEPALNTAASHHNKLGLSKSKVELLVVRGSDGRIVIAESIGAQNITALAARDQERPRTDAFVGMLPPKLARIMINLSGRNTTGTLLDPFCGTGTVLQESALLGYDVYGTDLSEKMVDYSRTNLDWIIDKYHLATKTRVEHGDATTYSWQQPIGKVVCETYLGQPFSAPPSPKKLTEVRGNCNYIISSFLENIRPQLATGTILVIAVPAWRDTDGNLTHLPLVQSTESLGYARISLRHASNEQLIYYRENQVVARELLLLKKLD